MRKNIEQALNAFKVGKSYQDKNIRADGELLYSYNLLIARREKDLSLSILSLNKSPSRTTTSHILAVTEYFAGQPINIVQEF